MSFIFDLPGAIVQAVVLWRESKAIKAWTTLVFTMGFSGLTGFLFAAGGALIAGHGWLVSVGYGMVSGAVSLVALFLISPLTRGMTVTLPKGLVEKYQKTADEQTKITHI